MLFGIIFVKRDVRNMRFKSILILIIVLTIISIIVIIIKIDSSKNNMFNQLSEDGTMVNENQMKEDIKILANIEHMNTGNLVYLANNGSDGFLQYQSIDGYIDKTKKVIEVCPAARKAKYEKESSIEIRFIMRTYLYLKQRNYNFEIIAIRIVYKPLKSPVFSGDNVIEEYIRNLDKTYEEIYYEGATDEEIITKMTEKWIEDTGYVRISYD